MALTAGIVIINAFLFGTVYSNTCSSFKISKENINTALIGHSILAVNDTNHYNCAQTCMAMSVCKSIDFDRNEHVCKLNDVDQSSVDPSEFETKQGSIFSDISEWPSSMVGSCGSRPCKANQRCYQNGASHVCKDIITSCAFDQKIENGEIQTITPDENKFLDVALVKCYQGYVPSQEKVKCEASGKWQPATCTKEKYCGNPPDVPNAQLLGSTNTLTYECAPEYYPTASSNATLTCTKAGWGPANNFSCFTCGEPNEVFGASLNGSGQVRQYVCNTDDPEHLYPVPGTGNGTITCDENTQTWSPEGFRCGGLRLKANHPKMQEIPNCGYLEFFHNNEWRAVTFEVWDWRATKVACNTLGFKFGGTFHKHWFDVENPQRLAAAYKLDNIACFGNETSLELCSDIDPKYGDINKEIALTCFDYDITAPGNVELDPGPNSGGIRVKIAATYGNLCGEDWSDKETGVVCRTMNPNWRRYQECIDNCNVIPKQPYKTNYIHCEGDEPHLFYCENRGWGYTTDCNQSKLVNVLCGQ